MRNKNILIGAAVALGIIILILVVLLMVGGTRAPLGEDEQNPFGDTSGTRPVASTTGQGPFGELATWLTDNTEDEGEKAPLFRAITTTPALGPVAIANPANEQGELVRFADRSNGNLLETPLAVVEQPTVVSNKTVLRLGEVLWTSNGSSTILRHLNTASDAIGSYLTTIDDARGGDADETENNAPGRYLESNIVSISFSPDNRSVFYITKDDGGSTGYVESIETGATHKVWSSPLQQLTATWGSENSILVYTNPSAIAQGFVWAVNPARGTSYTVLGGLYALAARLNPAGDKMLYSMHESFGGLPSLRVRTLGTADVAYLPLQTIVEKCAWGPQGSVYIYCAIPNNFKDTRYLERWYQGALSSDDTLWRFDTMSGQSKQLIDPKAETKTAFDIVDISVSPSESYLVFRERMTDLIWALELPKETQIPEEAPEDVE